MGRTQSIFAPRYLRTLLPYIMYVYSYAKSHIGHTKGFVCIGTQNLGRYNVVELQQVSTINRL